MELVRSLLWLPGFWTTLIGVIIGICASFGIVWWQNRRQRKFAAMQVVTNLRHWMTRTLQRHDDTVLWVDSDGRGGTAYSKIPDFRFEGSLEQVSLLDRKTAKNIFNLIHEKDDANAGIEATFEFEDAEEARDVFRGRSAKLFLDAWTIYTDVSRRVGWLEEVFPEIVKERMQSEVARLKEIEKSRAESSAEIFAGVNGAGGVNRP